MASYAASSSNFEAGILAEDGVAGIDLLGYELKMLEGWEPDQQYAKNANWAVCWKQNAYDYLTKIDLENNNIAPEDGSFYTKSEHYWDKLLDTYMV